MKSDILTHKPLGGRLQQFRLKGLPIWSSHRVVGQHLFVLRLHFALPNYDNRYILSVQHFKNGKLVEAVCLRDGYAGKTAAMEAIRGITLATGTDPVVEQALDDLKTEAVAEIGRFKAPPTEMEIASGRTAVKPAPPAGGV